MARNEVAIPQRKEQMTQKTFESTEVKEQKAKPEPKEGMSVKLQGYISKIAYQKGHFHIIKLGREDASKGEAKKKDVTCIGTFNEPPEIGSIYDIEGTLQKNERFNEWQIKITNKSKLHGPQRRGLIRFLETEVKGIGTKYAEQLYVEFGDRALHAVIDTPHEVANGLNVPLARAQMWSDNAIEVRDNAEIRQEFYTVNIPKGKIDLIIDFLHNRKSEDQSTIDALKQHVFGLTKMHGIGFLTASNIADKIGVPRNARPRIKHCLVYVLEDLCNKDGHTCIDSEQLISKAQDILKLDAHEIRPELDWLIENRHLATETSNLEDYVEKKDSERKSDAEKR